MYNTYSSIVPSEMTNRELQHMCTELQTAKNWNKSQATVKLKTNGMLYNVDVADIEDYREAHTTITGQLHH